MTESTVKWMRTYDRAVFAAVLVLVCITAVSLWFWWTSFDRPYLVERPHAVLWDVVSIVSHESGRASVSGINGLADNPLAHFAAFTMKHFGGDFRAIVAAQLPFMLLLIISVALIAYRLGGPFAGGFAAICTLFAPMTIGPAVQGDDLLPLQALMAAAVAILVFCADSKQKLLALFAAVPVWFAVRIAFYSNAFLFLMVFGCATGAYLVGLPMLAMRRRKSIAIAIRSMGELPWWPAVIAILIGLWQLFPFPSRYFAEEAANPVYAAVAPMSSLETLLAYPTVWGKIMTGQLYVVLTVASIAILVRRKQWNMLIGPAGWLFLPMLVLSVLSKRHDWYLVTAIPATYVLIGLGMAQIDRMKWRIAAAVLITLMLYGHWGGLRTSVDEENYADLNKVFLRVPKPFLLSPHMPPPDYVALAEAIHSTCRERPVVFADVPGINGVETFYLWHRAPQTRIGDLWLGPAMLDRDPCLVAKMDQDVSRPYTIDKALDQFETVGERSGKMTAAIHNRLERAKKIAFMYKPAAEHFNWVIFTPGLPAIGETP